MKFLIESSSCCLNIVPIVPLIMFHLFGVGGAGNAKLATDESLAKCTHAMLCILVVGKQWETWVESSSCVFVRVRGGACGQILGKHVAEHGQAHVPMTTLRGL